MASLVAPVPESHAIQTRVTHRVIPTQTVILKIITVLPYKLKAPSGFYPSLPARFLTASQSLFTTTTYCTDTSTSTFYSYSLLPQTSKSTTCFFTKHKNAKTHTTTPLVTGISPLKPLPYYLPRLNYYHILPLPLQVSLLKLVSLS